MLSACTNFGVCDFAGEPLFGARCAACPNCGKLFASPHRVDLDQPHEIIQTGGEWTARAVFHRRKIEPPTVTSIVLDMGGKHHPMTECSTSEEEQVYTAVIPLERGLHCAAVIASTDDGLATASPGVMVLVDRGPDQFTLWAWALILIVVLSVSIVLSLAGPPIFGAPSPWWPGILADLCLLFAPLAIGSLFIHIGRREWTAAAGGPFFSVL